MWKIEKNANTLVEMDVDAVLVLAADSKASMGFAVEMIGGFLAVRLVCVAKLDKLLPVV